ncbi:MAG: hypothetical protein IK100_09225 [Muribaculaceae bacterium]|nr:hypothetical protein [Muribaculaceae bacterium]
MKQKLLITLALLMTWGTGIAWAQTNATSITSGGYYRIYGNGSQGKSYLISNGSSLAGTGTNTVYSGTDNKDVWQITSGANSGTYTVKNVYTDTYINITAGYGKADAADSKDHGGSSSLSASSQDLVFTDNSTYWYIGDGTANSYTDPFTQLNFNRTNIYVWDDGDANNAILLYPISLYTMKVTGETAKSVTITAKGHSGVAANDGTLYIDDSAAQGDLTATTDGGYKATITSFDTGNKTITVNVTANVVGTYKLTPVFSKGAVDGTYYFNLPTTENSSPTLSTSEATVQLIECGKGYMMKNGDCYLAYKGGKSGSNDDYWSLIATTDASKAAVLTISFSDGKIMLNGTNTYSTTGFLCYNDVTAPADGRSLYGDGNPSGTTKAYFAYQWTIAEFTPATTYTRVFEAAQTYTVCLPMAVNTSDVTNGKFYELASYSDNTLHFNEVSGTTTAYKPYLFVTSAAGVVLSGDITAYSSQDLTTTVSGASMIGTIGSQTLVSGTNTYYGYRASNGVFVQIGSTTGAHIGAYRAYIQIPGSVGVKAFNVVLDDATGIETVSNFKTQDSGVFNLAGQRVSTPTRGLYIVNGKKVAVK